MDRRSGGIQGGLSNGESIVIKVAFKPTSTIAKKQNTVSRDGEDVDLLARGRHDPCVVPRAVPMVEAMVALVLADQLLQVASYRPSLFGLLGLHPQYPLTFNEPRGNPCTSNRADCRCSPWFAKRALVFVGSCTFLFVPAPPATHRLVGDECAGTSG